MSSTAGQKPQFYGYPTAKEVVDIRYDLKESSNPVLRGRALVFVTWLFVFSKLY